MNAFVHTLRFTFTDPRKASHCNVWCEMLAPKWKCHILRDPPLVAWDLRPTTYAWLIGALILVVVNSSFAEVTNVLAAHSTTKVAVFCLLSYWNNGEGRRKRRLDTAPPMRTSSQKRLSMSRISQFYLHAHAFLHERNEPYLPLPLQPKLVLIHRPRDGGLGWPHNSIGNLSPVWWQWKNCTMIMTASINKSINQSINLTFTVDEDIHV